VAGGAEGLPNKVTSMLVVPAVKNIQTHHYTTGRLRRVYIPVSASTHRHRWPTSDISWLQIMPYGSRPLHTLAGSHSTAGQYGRDGSQHPAVRMDKPLRMPAHHQHRVAAFPLLGQHVRQPSFTHDGFPPSRQRPCGEDASKTEGRHNVPSAGALDLSPPPRAPRHTYFL